MRRQVTIDLSQIAKISIALLTGVIIFFTIYGMAQFSSRNTDRNVEGIRQLIDKALITCYALEGSYPANIEQVERYGVILDQEKYIYHYEWYGGNLKPMVAVMERW